MRLSLPRGSRLRTAAVLVSAALAALALYSYLKSLEERTAVSGPLLRIAVAATDIAAGTRIDAGAVDWRAMPERYITGGMLTAGVEGRVARHDLARGELLLEGDLSASGEAGSIALRLAPGTRGYPLPLEGMALPAGGLHAGDRLDVVAVQDESAETILERVVLLDLVGGESASGGGSLPGIAGSSNGYAVLQLRPEEAEDLARAACRQSGSIVLVICPLEKAND